MKSADGSFGLGLHPARRSCLWAVSRTAARSTDPIEKAGWASAQQSSRIDPRRFASESVQKTPASLCCGSPYRQQPARQRMWSEALVTHGRSYSFLLRP